MADPTDKCAEHTRAWAPLNSKLQIRRMQKLLKNQLPAVQEADRGFATVAESPLP